MRRVLAELAAARENTCCPKRTLLTIIEKNVANIALFEKKCVILPRFSHRMKRY